MHQQEQWQSLPTWGSSETSPANSSQGSVPQLVLKFLFTSLWQDGSAGKDVCHTSSVVKSSSHRWKSRANSIQLFSNFLRISVLVSHIAQDHEWAHLSRRCSHLGGGSCCCSFLHTLPTRTKNIRRLCHPSEPHPRERKALPPLWVETSGSWHGSAHVNNVFTQGFLAFPQ